MADPQVSFIRTTAENLDMVPYKEGQVIAVADQAGLYYDMDGDRHNPAESIIWEPME